jgi:hypothetical protein
VAADEEGPSHWQIFGRQQRKWGVTAIEHTGAKIRAEDAQYRQTEDSIPHRALRKQGFAPRYS